MPLHNHIPERAQPGIHVPSETKELEENEVIPERVSPSEVGDDISNKVSMSSTTQDSNIFERTEVLAGKALWSPLPHGEGTGPFSPFVHLGASEDFISLRGWGMGGRIHVYQRLLKNRRGTVSLSPLGTFQSRTEWPPGLII